MLWGRASRVCEARFFLYERYRTGKSTRGFAKTETVSQPLIRRRTFATIESIVVLTAVIALQYVVAGSGRKPALSDFRVVYCAERAVMQRADPYRAEPLRTCEDAVNPEPGHAPWMVTPFPLPGYTAAIFFPLGLLPFKLAEIAWLALLVLAFAIASAILAELVETRVWPIALVLAPSVGVLNLAYGEPVDIAIAAICIAALCVVRDRPRIASFAAAAATIEPHVGLPACIGLFVAIPRARIPLVVLGALFALLSIATLGPQNNIEYFATFLPLQAHAEVYAADQYSLTRVLFLMGFSPDIALLRGTISYFVMMVVGVFAARRMIALGVSPAVAIPRTGLHRDVRRHVHSRRRDCGRTTSRNRARAPIGRGANRRIAARDAMGIHAAQRDRTHRYGDGRRRYVRLTARRCMATTCLRRNDDRGTRGDRRRRRAARARAGVTRRTRRRDYACDDLFDSVGVVDSVGARLARLRSAPTLAQSSDVARAAGGTGVGTGT